MEGPKRERPECRSRTGNAFVFHAISVTCLISGNIGGSCSFEPEAAGMRRAIKKDAACNSALRYFFFHMAMKVLELCLKTSPLSRGCQILQAAGAPTELATASAHDAPQALVTTPNFRPLLGGSPARKPASLLAFPSKTLGANPRKFRLK